jgi:hypothetical protein
MKHREAEPRAPMDVVEKEELVATILVSDDKGKHQRVPF